MTPKRIVSNVLLAGLGLAAPSLATAASDEVERPLRATQARMQQLDDRIQAAPAISSIRRISASSSNRS